MSVYRGRTGPNFSNYLNSLNTVSPPYDPATGFGDDLLDPNSDLSIFTNTDFTSMDDSTFNFDLPTDDKTSPAAFENFLPPGLPAPNTASHAQSPSDSAQWYNTPIQPAPMPNFSSVDNTSPTVTTAAQPGKKADGNAMITAEEKSRLAAEEDKRRRNTAASARFRVKKKQREQALETNLKEAQDKAAKLEAKLGQLEMENKWLKDLITEKNGMQSKEEMAAAYQKFRKESEERDVKHTSEHTTGVGTN